MAKTGRALVLPAFRLFLLSRVISWVGNSITLVAVPMLVFQLTASPALTGLVATAEALPYLMLGLPAGALVDRWDRKRVLVRTGVASGLLTATIPVASLMDVLTVPHLFVVTAGVSSLFVFFDAAGFGAIPVLVGRERVPSATAAMVACNTVINLAGPAVGGALAASIGSAPAIGIDALAYLVAAAVTVRADWASASHRFDCQPLAVRGLLQDIGEGLKYAWNVRILRWLTLIAIGVTVSHGAVFGLTVVAGVEQLGLTKDDPRLGLLYSATGLGAFLVSLAVPRIQRTIPTGQITILALIISWPAQLIWAYTRSFWVGVMILTVFQAATTLSSMNGVIVRQTITPDHLQARVNTTARTIGWIGMPIGATLGGAVAGCTNVSTAIVVCSLGAGLGLVLAFGAAIWRVPPLAQLAPTLWRGR